jgi:prepilin signal peptidase PulO-like enzyme (type II secretory pathway)
MLFSFDPLLFVFFALGALLASFAGVVSERAYTGQSWRAGRSRCDSCGETLSARDLVPVLSWLAAGGRCRVCGSRVSGRHLAAELLQGTAFAAAYAALGLTPALGAFLAALLPLCFIVLYDLRHTVVPPPASLLLALLALLYAALSAPDARVLGLRILVAGVVGLAFFLLHVFSRGRAMGLGDAPVAFSLSLLAGPAALSGLVLSFWIGAVVGIAILVGRPKGRRMGIEVPFVPFMAAGFLLALFTGWQILPLPF